MIHKCIDKNSYLNTKCCCLFCFCFLYILTHFDFTDQEEPFKKWCISQSYTPDSKLQQVLDNVCARMNCKEILPGGSCYTPNNYMNHGSYAIDLDYRVNNVCDQTYAKFTAKDPCKFLLVWILAHKIHLYITSMCWSISCTWTHININFD